jgi:hypothetical protein
VAIAAGAFEPFYLRIFTTDRARFGAMLAGLPYRKMPGMRQFLLDVRARTNDGDAVAIAAPFPRTVRSGGGDDHVVTATREGGYDYIYNRACYLLAGRRVVPLPAPGDPALPRDLRNAAFIAAYRCDPAVPGFVVVWRGPDGELLRRMP